MNMVTLRANALSMARVTGAWRLSAQSALRLLPTRRIHSPSPVFAAAQQAPDRLPLVNSMQPPQTAASIWCLLR